MKEMTMTTMTDGYYEYISIAASIDDIIKDVETINGAADLFLDELIQMRGNLTGFNSRTDAENAVVVAHVGQSLAEIVEIAMDNDWDFWDFGDQVVAKCEQYWQWYFVSNHECTRTWCTSHRTTAH
jgi:hypothetical protein